MKLFNLLSKSSLTVLLFFVSSPLFAHGTHKHSDMTPENTIWHAGYWGFIGVFGAGLLFLGLKVFFVLRKKKIDARL
jgi:hypothetical protein